jgi:hypothetical protein
MSRAAWEYPTMPPGTLPPVVLPFDPTSTVPVRLIALDSKSEPEQVLFDVARYEVRNMVMRTTLGAVRSHRTHELQSVRCKKERKPGPHRRFYQSAAMKTDQGAGRRASTWSRSV